MERKRDGLRHITEAFGGLDGLVEVLLCRSIYRSEIERGFRVWAVTE